MNIDCPNCNTKLPYKARYFQYFTCKPCHTILVAGKERGVAFDIKLFLVVFILFSFVAVPMNIALLVAAIASVLATIWLHVTPPVFRVKQPAFVPPEKEKVDVAANIKRYKEDRSKKKASRKWFR